MELDLLAIAPHPDDAEFFCGGLIALSSLRGYLVGIADLSEGELASQGTVEGRRAESASSTSLLNLAARLNLGLPDGNLGGGRDALGVTVSQPRAMQLARLVAAIRSTRPKVLVIPYWEDRHPDHPAASKLCEDAIFLAGARNYQLDLAGLSAEPIAFTSSTSSVRGPLTIDSRPFSPLQVIYYPFRRELRPSFVVDISSVSDQKYAAVSCYQSQIVRQQALSQQDGMSPLASSPLMVNSLRGRDCYYGAMIGSAAGEPYYSRAAIHIPDPVAHAAANPLPNVLLFPE